MGCVDTRTWRGDCKSGYVQIEVYVKWKFIHFDGMKWNDEMKGKRKQECRRSRNRGLQCNLNIVCPMERWLCGVFRYNISKRGVGWRESYSWSENCPQAPSFCIDDAFWVWVSMGRGVDAIKARSVLYDFLVIEVPHPFRLLTWKEASDVPRARSISNRKPLHASSALFLYWR
jgi:hypothetical protein